MKKIGTGFLFSMLALLGCAQKNETTKTISSNTLLWKISGNGLSKPSYLFGTIHMLCEEDALLSPNMKKAIKDAEDVYLEVDMDNMMEMLGILGQLKMNGDSTLQDLLTKEEYEKVKDYFESKQSMIPFSMLETFKPMLAASLLDQGNLPCDATSSMEQVIMAEAKQHEKTIKGLETMAYQAGMLDSIPYKLQAQQLANFVKNAGKEDEGKELKEMLDAYRNQDLQKLEDMIRKSDVSISSFTELLLYNRNRNWVKKLKKLMPEKPLVIAVGAGHLPGDQGVINLLKKEGYKVEPVENKVSKAREI